MNQIKREKEARSSSITDKTEVESLLPITMFWKDYSINNQATKSYGENRSRVLQQVKAAVKKGLYPEILTDFDKEIERGTADLPQINIPAPEIDFLWSSNPKAKKLSDYKGKVIVLDFWATWCGPCMASVPEMNALKKYYEGKPVIILGVTSIQGRHVEDEKVTETENNPNLEIKLLKELLANKEMSWNFAVSKQDVFNSDYRVGGIPFMAIIDARGIVRFNGIQAGGTPIQKKIRMIDSLLKQS